MKSRLWVITECYYPEVVSTGQYLTQIAEGLSDTFEVKVICGQPNYLSRGTKAPIFETRNGVEIFRVWSTLLDKNVVFYRLVNMISFGISMFFAAVRKFKRGDKILVVSAPPNLPITTALAAMLRGSTYTPLIHDLYPDQLIALETLRPGSFFTSVLEFLNRWLFKSASSVIVVGRDMNDKLKAKTSGLGIPIYTIQNWADLDTVSPQLRSSNQLLTELGIQDKLVILSAGNIGRPTDIGTIAACAVRLADDERFHFVFVGWGAKGPWLESVVSEHGLKNISILGQRPREDQTSFLNACDVGLVSLAKNMKGTAMPSRTYNLMAAGKPIIGIADDGSELVMTIEDDNIGWHVRPGDVDALHETLYRIFDSRDLLPLMGERAREAAENKFSFSIAIEKYRSALG